MMPSKRLAVIGGGMGGVATAWFCDRDFQISLFETKEKLGGNADSETVRHGGRDLVVDLGAQFFHPETHPTYCALLELLELHRIEIPGSLCVVPLDGGAPSFSSTSVIRTPRYALDFAIFSYASRRMAATGDYAVTMSSWVDALRVSQHFKTQILLPWLTASEGHPLDDTKRSSARAILELFAPTQPKSPWIKSRIWSPRDGFQGTILALARGWKNTTVQTRSRVSRVEKVDDDWFVCTEGSRSGPFDAIVVNAPPWESKQLLAGLPWAEALRGLLDRYEHLSHRLTIHADPTYVHSERRNWCLANVGLGSAKPERSELSIWYGAAFPKLDGKPVDLFKSWTTYRDRDPVQGMFERTFQHSIKTPTMMDASRQLRSWQGKEGLWFVGQFMNGIDLQESALRSAMEVGRSLCPASPSLAALERRATMIASRAV
jgi:predicted NAD/FAD-binding protein